MVTAGDIDGARKKLNDLLQHYSRTRAARQARSLAIEMAVIGKPAPETLAVEKWYQGESEGEGSLKAKGATLSTAIALLTTGPPTVSQKR